uniref:GPI ethanolamine phosphate transferase 3 n=1 Tax=Panagrellus redivivus TaxID=6233 RepID=A0A7E4UNJ5_PANRE
MRALGRLGLIVAALISGLLVFQRGFLLKRTVLRHTSSCDDVIAGADCWIAPSYKKVVWVVIDALRHDFVLPLGAGETVGRAERHYRGHMPKMGRLLNKESGNARLFRFIADAPTTTLQRLKALTTGTLPTFIEAGDNFGGAEILEDNIIDQIRASGRNVTFLGDDTWLSLLPGRFHREFGAPSFDIKDLHSVDDAVDAKLWDELNRDDWTVLIAHCLGVDHAGHRYGPDHEEMAKKLTQMDNMVAKVIATLDEDTLLMVMGDHGMTTEGDHGGDSERETKAALFVYSKRGLPEKAATTVAQVDLVPTLALLLDVPIPFSSLGTVITSLIPSDKLTHALKLVCMQIVRFAQVYTQREPALVTELSWVFREFEARAEADPTASANTIKTVQNVLRTAWTNFDLDVARLGLFAVLEGLLFAAVQLTAILNHVKGHFFGQINFAVWLFRTGVFFLEAALLATPRNPDSLILGLLNVCLIGSILYHAIVVVVQLLSVSIAWWKAIPFGFVVLHALSFTSNSFIVYESSVVRFLLTTVLVVGFGRKVLELRTTRKAPSKTSIALFIGALLAIRFGTVFERCREERLQCESTLFSAVLGSLETPATKLLRVSIGFAVLICLNQFLVSDSKPAAIADPNLRIFTAGSWPVTLCIGLHWLCDAVSASFDIVGLRSAQLVYAYVLVVAIGSSLLLRRQNVIRMTFHAAVLAITMVLGDGLAPSVAMLLFINDVTNSLLRDSTLWHALSKSLLISHGFFALGHTATLAQIPWQAAFVGIPGNFAIQALPASLVIIHLFAAQILIIWRDSGLGRGTEGSLLAFLAFSGCKAFGTVIASLIHRRHLMVFKIFAPKFIFEGIGFIVLCAFYVTYDKHDVEPMAKKSKMAGAPKPCPIFQLALPYQGPGRSLCVRGGADWWKKPLPTGPGRQGYNWVEVPPVCATGPSLPSLSAASPLSLRFFALILLSMAADKDVDSIHPIFRDVCRETQGTWPLALECRIPSRECDLLPRFRCRKSLLRLHCALLLSILAILSGFLKIPSRLPQLCFSVEILYILIADFPLASHLNGTSSLEVPSAGPFSGFQ